MKLFKSNYLLPFDLSLMPGQSGKYYRHAVVEMELMWFFPQIHCKLDMLQELSTYYINPHEDIHLN